MREFVHHLIQTILFRLEKATEHANEEFAVLDIGSGVRKPIEILRHMTDVIVYAEYILTDQKKERQAHKDWDVEYQNFVSQIRALGQNISESDLSSDHAKRIIQGPLADVLTHVGQLAMLSRMNGSPVAKLNYSKVPIGDHERNNRSSHDS